MIGEKIAYKYWVAILYAIVLFLDRLDLTIVNIILPTLANHFNVAITQTEWINNAFLLALAMSMPISAWLGDRFGTKKIFVLATAIFGLTSLLCALAPTLLFMIMMRFLQGLAGGVIIPIGMTMVYRAFPVTEYVSITSFIFIPTLIAPALAPTLGGIIVYFFHWQWVFLFAVPLCLIITLIALLLLQEQKNGTPHPLDWPGFFLSTCGITLLLYFLSILAKQGWNFQTYGFLGSALCFLYGFLKWEQQAPCPLIEFKFFRHILFLQANFIQLAFQICHLGSIFLVGIYLQVGVGLSAMAAGLIMGMQALGAMCTSRYSVKLFHRFGPKLPIISGFIGMAIFTLMILSITQPSMALVGAAVLFVRGLCSGLCGAPIQAISVIDFNKTEISQASVVFNVGRQIAISLGIALSAFFIAYGFKIHGISSLHLSIPVDKKIFYTAFGLIPVIAILGILTTLGIDNEKVINLTAKNERN